MSPSFQLMVLFLLLDFRDDTLEYTTWIEDGKFKRTFSPKACDGQSLIHLFPQINAILFMPVCRLSSTLLTIGSAATESVANITEIHDGLDFSADDEGGYSFGIFSLKFSTDGREIVAGSSDDSIYVYDLDANKRSLRISAHMSDVNTVCFADESGHIIYSGSDDNLCKVWDRRCFIAKGKSAGVLTGHLEGITFLDSHGDGRYFISNGKDQAIKLWDIRRMSSNVTCNPVPKDYEWDYRWRDYPRQARDLKHPCDQSLATYKGHSVLQTLIRCYFSPAYSTGQKYIYSGSADSCVYIYDLVWNEIYYCFFWIWILHLYIIANQSSCTVHVDCIKRYCKSPFGGTCRRSAIYIYIYSFEDTKKVDTF
ncbi:hypothetical protein L1049_004282 [Liquidambar formosana]|uniref:LEC14B protein n=1 Tax=Liquidambar formosana TaxID=63359 RepID=A0AAP0RN12_LIQFO